MNPEKIEIVWSAKDVVDLVRAISWPIAATFIVLLSRGKLSKAIEMFFKRNNVTELRAAGFSAKFSESAQVKEAAQVTSDHSDISSISQDYQVLVEYQKENESKHSKALLKQIRLHRDSYKISVEKQLEIAEVALSQSQASNNYFHVNKFIYRSQFELLSTMTTNGNAISVQDAHQYFESVKLNYAHIFSHTDLHQYMAYLLSSGLVKKSQDHYSLTDYGESYMEYMSRYSDLISQLTLS
ncbi:conserved hypothetical protein [Vibrio chagasii]|nr:conserved hypothetical protein [Vibrio chagasii]CAH7179482.1 conserved hypothetical protein [Vibrio chagasii]CAH7217314.1 conserved hypothetical protein [Vibrio chagasii]CAH7251854.1 conserved hypothetical protein [Vibrio chagasii]CAH7440714.1 conserved hypothetical protein [Vibrio chagasii]